MPIPIHAEWKALKKKHGVPDGAVSGMNLGKVLDTYHSHLVYSAQAAAANGALAQTATEQLAKYLSKLDKKRSKRMPMASRRRS